MSTSHERALLELFKVLGDDSRYQMLRRLQRDELNVGDLAQAVGLSEPTVSHHLARLRDAGLVTLRMDGTQRFYRVSDSGIARLKRLVEQIDQVPPEAEPEQDNSWIDALDWSDEDKRVLREHTSGGRITVLPAKRKKQLVILCWLATKFTAGVTYTEKEVNAIIREVYAEDYVVLRRDLVDMGYLRREKGGGSYWVEAE